VDNRNSTLDILKGLAIVIVLITHYAWTREQRLIPIFPYLIDMAVPIFMIISGYVGALSFHRHGIDSLIDAYSFKEISRKIIRYTIPFIIIVLWQIIDPNTAINADGIMAKIRWIINGASGPGSYYYPVLIQLVFIFPLIYFVIERKGRLGLWICLGINAVYEVLKWSYGMSEDCYRLLIFRYIFVIAIGVYAYKYALGKMASVIMTIIGAIFIGLTCYGIYNPRIITFWTSTCFISSMWIVPFIVYLIRNVNIKFIPIEILGRASYNIFLVQMVYYYAYRKILASLIDVWYLELITGVLICIVLGVLFYLVESRLTRKIIEGVGKWKMSQMSN